MVNVHELVTRYLNHLKARLGRIDVGERGYEFQKFVDSGVINYKKKEYSEHPLADPLETVAETILSNNLSKKEIENSVIDAFKEVCRVAAMCEKRDVFSDILETAKDIDEKFDISVHDYVEEYIENGEEVHLESDSGEIKNVEVYFEDSGLHRKLGESEANELFLLPGDYRLRGHYWNKKDTVSVEIPGSQPVVFEFSRSAEGEKVPEAEDNLVANDGVLSRVTAHINNIISGLTRVSVRSFKITASITVQVIKWSVILIIISLGLFAVVTADWSLLVSPSGNNTTVNRTSPINLQDNNREMRGGISVFNASKVEQKIHYFINQERVERGLNALSYDEDLAEIAVFHSRQMKQYGFFDHTNPVTQATMEDRYNKFDYVCSIEYGDMVYGGAENIATSYWKQEIMDTKYTYGDGYYTNMTELARAIVYQWMHSQGHKRNILKPYWENEGIGIIKTDDGKIYATQNFC